MSAADVLDVAYTMLTDRAVETDRALLASGRETKDGVSVREALDRDLGLTGDKDPTGTRVVSVGEFSLPELAAKLGVA